MALIAGTFPRQDHRPAAAGHERRRHIAHLEGLRAVAALTVFVNHAYAQSFDVVGATANDPGWLSPVRYSLIAGHLAVSVFIVISGFCLTLPVVAAGDRLKSGIGDFFRRRARRILPAYYAAVALSLALIWTLIGQPTGTLWDVPIAVTPSAIVSHLLLLQDLFGTSKINYVFWSIAVEWQIYFLFPLLVWAWRRRGPFTTVASALVTGYALSFLLTATRGERSNPHFIGLFALGMFAAYVSTSPLERYRRLQARFPWALAAAAAFVVTCGLSVAWGVAVSRTRFPMLDLPVAIVASCLLVMSCRDSGNLAARIFSWKPLVMIGTFSYSLYLVHAPLLQLVWQYVLQPAHLDGRTTFAALMTGGLAFVLMVAYGFFRLFEEPFMRPSTGSRRQAASMPARVGVGVA
jgi:peptidoglycan/LPS O-acetylase OafA/YrhL